MLGLFPFGFYRVENINLRNITHTHTHTHNHTHTVVPGAEHYLGPIETAICEKFIPALLQVSDPVDDNLRQLLSQGVKFGGLALRNPVTSAPLLHQSSVDECDVLVKALHEGGGLNATAHKACVREAGNQARKARGYKRRRPTSME
jgi:hypothetical protein